MSTVKYQNAQGQTWSGRGRRPQWMIDALAAGATLESLLTPAVDASAFCDKCDGLGMSFGGNMSDDDMSGDSEICERCGGSGRAPAAEPGDAEHVAALDAANAHIVADEIAEPARQQAAMNPEKMARDALAAMSIAAHDERLKSAVARADRWALDYFRVIDAARGNFDAAKKLVRDASDYAEALVMNVQIDAATMQLTPAQQQATATSIDAQVELGLALADHAESAMTIAEHEDRFLNACERGWKASEYAEQSLPVNFSGENRDWINTYVHDALVVAAYQRAIAGLKCAPRVIHLVLGLPTAYFSAQKDVLKVRVAGLLEEYKAPGQRIEILVQAQSTVPLKNRQNLPDGKLDPEYSTETQSWAVIDIGHFTTDFSILLSKL